MVQNGRHTFGSFFDDSDRVLMTCKIQLVEFESRVFSSEVGRYLSSLVFMYRQIMVIKDLSLVGSERVIRHLEGS